MPRIAEKVVELQVTAKSKVGVLASILEAVAATRINILAYNASEVKGKGIIQLVTKNPTKASAAIRKLGFKIDRKNAIYVLFSDRVGSGAKISRKLADCKINILYSYGTSARSQKYGFVVKTNKDAVALKVLNSK